MGKILITGGSGFFGEILETHLLQQGHEVVNVDLVRDPTTHRSLVSYQGDIRDAAYLDREIFQRHTFSGIVHCAAILAHAVKDRDFLWQSNVDGTRNVAELAKKYGVKKIVFTSTNCLWARNYGRAVREDDPPEPVEIYGRSKWEGEKILNEYRDCMDVVLIRCPTITDAGRLGLLGILFEFIDEGRRVWVVGGGENRYQFIYAPDLVDACVRSLAYGGSEIFNVGSDDVKSFREVYGYVIRHAGTSARVASLPKAPTLWAMRMAYAMKLSPLGPYQYKMIAEDFYFDTRKIKETLRWAPTLTNEQMLLKAYQYYHENLREIKSRTGVSAHKQIADMGILRLVKWLS